MNKKFLYGIGKIMYRDFVIGYIKKDSFDVGGVKAEAAKVFAEQVQGTSVLVIPQSNGSIAPNFALIQLDYANLYEALGGTLHYAAGDTEKKTPIGWSAPSELLQLSGPWRIDLISGRSILIADAVLLSNLGGKLTLKETAEIACTLELQQPSEGKAYGIFDSDNIPEAWNASYIIPAEEVLSKVSEG